MGMTQREIAKKMGISRAMVFKIERSALAKLRKRLLAMGITWEDIGLLRKPKRQTLDDR